MSKQKKVDFVLVNSLLDEADKTLADDTRVAADVDGDLGNLLDTILKSEAFGVGAAGAGLIAGGIAGVGLLSALGTVTGLSAAGITSGLAAAGGLIGGGMVVGIGVLAAPALVLGGGAFYAANKIRQKKLIQEKEMLIQRIIVAHERLLKKLEQQNAENSERVAYLNLLIDILLGVKKDIEDSIPKKGTVDENADLSNEEEKEVAQSDNIETNSDKGKTQTELSQNLSKAFSAVKGTMFSLAEQIKTIKGIPMPDFSRKEKTKDEARESKKTFGKEVDVLKHQRERLSESSKETQNQTQLIDEAEKKINTINGDAKDLEANLPLSNENSSVKVKKKKISKV